jgi:hypothetical protein
MDRRSFLVDPRGDSLYWKWPSSTMTPNRLADTYVVDVGSIIYSALVAAAVAYLVTKWVK